MLMKILTHILATVAALLIIAHVVPGITVAGLYTAIIVAILWGIIGFTLRPVLVILTLPINIVTFGLFSFIINALLFWFLSSFVAGFHVAGFIPALVGSLILSAMSWTLHAVL